MSKNKSKGSAKRNFGSHRRNPVGKPGHRRRRNPNFLGDPLSTTLKGVLSGAIGLLADVNLPAYLLGMFGMSDTGMLSYLIAASIVVIPAWALDKAGMKVAAKGYLYGSGAGLLWRVYDDVTGNSPVALTGGGMGAFNVQANVPLPGPNVFAAYNRRALPPASAPATTPAGSGSTMSVSKSASKSGMGYFLHGYRA